MRYQAALRPELNDNILPKNAEGFNTKQYKGIVEAVCPAGMADCAIIFANAFPCDICEKPTAACLWRAMR